MSYDMVFLFQNISCAWERKTAMRKRAKSETTTRNKIRKVRLQVYWSTSVSPSLQRLFVDSPFACRSRQTDPMLLRLAVILRASIKNKSFSKKRNKTTQEKRRGRSPRNTHTKRQVIKERRPTTHKKEIIIIYL